MTLNVDDLAAKLHALKNAGLIPTAVRATSAEIQQFREDRPAGAPWPPPTVFGIPLQVVTDTHDIRFSFD